MCWTRHLYNTVESPISDFEIAGKTFEVSGRLVGLASLHRILHLWLRKRRNRCLDKAGQILPVIHIADVEIVLRSVVRRSQNDFLQQGPAGLRHFDVEVVVTDKAEENAVAICAPVSHHLFHGNFPSVAALVDDILYKVRITSHIFFEKSLNGAFDISA